MDKQVTGKLLGLVLLGLVIATGYDNLSYAVMLIARMNPVTFHLINASQIMLMSTTRNLLFASLQNMFALTDLLNRTIYYSCKDIISVLAIKNVLSVDLIPAEMISQYMMKFKF